MLDIVIPAHKPNFKRMAHRGLKWVSGQAEKGITGTLPTTIGLVGTPGKVVLSLEGGNRQDFEAAEAYLEEQALPWQVIHNEGEVTTYREALLRGLEVCKSQLVAIIPPWIEVTDKLWVQRMIWSIGRDPTCLLCCTYEHQGAAKDLAPEILKPRRWAGGEFFVARREKLYENLILGHAEDMYVELAETAALNGWRLWAHPGVRFENHDHEDHPRTKNRAREDAGVASSDS